MCKGPGAETFPAGYQSCIEARTEWQSVSQWGDRKGKAERSRGGVRVDRAGHEPLNQAEDFGFLGEMEDTSSLHVRRRRTQPDSLDPSGYSMKSR